MKLLTTLDRAKWLDARRLGIGSSDAPVLLGASKKSLLELFAEKIGLTTDEEETELMLAGIELQPGIGRLFARRTGRTLIEVPPWTVYGGEIPFMLASPDFLCEPIEGRGLGGVEVKFVTFVQGDDWEEEPPLAAQIQVQHQMYVLGRDWWTIAGLVRGQLKYADVERDDRFLAVLLARAREFWVRVEQQDPPSPDASESARRILNELYPTEAPGKIIPLPPEAHTLDAQYLEGAAEEKAGKAKKDEAANQLRALIGDAERGVLPGGGYWSLTTVARKGYTVEPTTYRDLRRHKGK